MICSCIPSVFTLSKISFTRSVHSLVHNIFFARENVAYTLTTHAIIYILIDFHNSVETFFLRNVDICSVSRGKKEDVSYPCFAQCAVFRIMDSIQDTSSSLCQNISLESVFVFLVNLGTITE